MFSWAENAQDIYLMGSYGGEENRQVGEQETTKQ